MLVATNHYELDRIEILTHLAYIANGRKTCYIVQQFHWANKRDVTLRHL